VRPCASAAYLRRMQQQRALHHRYHLLLALSCNRRNLVSTPSTIQALYIPDSSRRCKRQEPLMHGAPLHSGRKLSERHLRVLPNKHSINDWDPFTGMHNAPTEGRRRAEAVFVLESWFGSKPPLGGRTEVQAEYFTKRTHREKES